MSLTKSRLSDQLQHREDRQDLTLPYSCGRKVTINEINERKLSACCHFICAEECTQDELERAIQIMRLGEIL